MYKTPLSPSARTQLLWMTIGTVLVVLVAAPFLVPFGAVGWFVLSCLGLCGIVAIGHREEHLHEAQDARG